MYSFLYYKLYILLIFNFIFLFAPHIIGHTMKNLSNFKSEGMHRINLFFEETRHLYRAFRFFIAFVTEKIAITYSS